MKLNNLNDLVAFIARNGLPHKAVPAQHAVEVGTRIRGRPGQMIIVWDPRATLLHIIAPLGIPVAEDMVPAVLDALARINHSLVLPGFGFNHEDRSLYYRWVVPRADDGMTEVEVDRAVKTVLGSVRDFWPALSAVASDERPSDEVMLVAAETRISPEAS